MALDEQTVRNESERFLQALRSGDVDQAAEQLSDELRTNLGQLVAMLPMPITEGTAESLERTASGFLVVLTLTGETETTRLETRWKDRDGRAVVVEISHQTEASASTEETSEQDAGAEAIDT